MILPAILGISALLIAIILLVNDNNKGFSSAFLSFIKKLGMKQDASQRIFSTLKGFLLILCLVIIFATLVYYFG